MQMTSRKRKQVASLQESPQLLEIIGELKGIIAQQTQEMKDLMLKHQEEMGNLRQQQRSEERQAAADPVTSQEQSRQETKEQSMIQKLAKFQKFAPPHFKEAKSPMEAEEWLDKLEKVIELLQPKEEDKMIFTNFLLEGEARTWWKMEKRKLGVDKVNWENFQRVFLEHYFPRSVCE